MSSEVSKTELVALFKQAGSAHHQAYIETNGDDPEWPLWYAQFLENKLPAMINQQMTRSEIVWLLLTLEKQRAAESLTGSWPAYYAEEILRRYA